MVFSLVSGIKTDFLPTRRFLLHYACDGLGRPLILIHGGGTWLYSFRRNFSALADNYSVYAIDMPGHGYTKTRTDHEIFTIETICAALLEFLDAMNLHKVHLAGHSWGGGWAAYFANKHPERVDKIILIDSSGMHPYDQPAWELMKYPVFEPFAYRFFSEKMIRKGLEKSFYNKHRVTEDMVKKTFAPLSDKTIVNAQLCYSQNINWKKIKAVFPEIRHKVLIIWGRNDRYIHVKHGKRMHRLIPDARLQIIDRCGHSAHEEHPETVNRLIIDFLDCPPDPIRF